MAERVKILTGNTLGTGDVIWWTGAGWSRDVNDSAPVGEDVAAIIAREAAAQNVVSAEVIDATIDGGIVRPAHIKDRIRALGPTVRPDLTLRPDDAVALAAIV